MGLNIRAAEFLLRSREMGVDFSTVCTLGHPEVLMSPFERRRLSRWLGGMETRGEVYSDFFFRALGCAKPQALDASEYEGAQLLHNLNEPLPRELHQRFSCVFDSGTLEHVWDFPRALQSCMELVKVGGHLVIGQMANNFMGHGLYQFSPELFYSALTPENGYRVKSILLSVAGIWYEARSPREIKERVEATTKREAHIYVLAQRISDVTPFVTPPHQSDYAENLGQVAQSASNRIVRKAAWKQMLGDVKWELLTRYKRWAFRRENSLSNTKRFRRIGRSLGAAGLSSPSFGRDPIEERAS